MTHCSLEIPEQKQANSKSSVYKELPRQGVFFSRKYLAYTKHPVVLLNISQFLVKNGRYLQTLLELE